MGDPFDVDAAIRAVKGSSSEMLSKQTAMQLAKSVMALRNAQNTNSAKAGTGSIGAVSNVAAPATPVGNSGGGGGGGSAAAAVDPNAELTTLVAGLKGLSDAEIKALMAQVKANYAQYVGDVPTDATGLLQQLLGANFDPNDPNYAAMMADPNIAAMMGQFEEMGETGDQNMTTDLSWFLKQQEMYNQYLATLPAMIAAAETGGGGGGGGGGGYGRGGGGYGGGGSGGGRDGVEPFETEKFSLSNKMSEYERATGNFTEENPGLDEAYFGRLPEVEAAFMAAGIPIELAGPAMRDFWDSVGGEENPANAVEDIVETVLPDAESQLNDYYLDEEGNAAWMGALGLPGQGGSFDNMIEQYASLMGNLVVDDPETDEFEFMSPNPDLEGVRPTITNPDDEDFVGNFAPFYETFLNPENYDNDTLMGKGTAGLQRAINYFNTYQGRRQMGAPVHQEDALAQFQSPSEDVLAALQVAANPQPSEDDYILDDTQLPTPDPDWFYANSDDAQNSNSTTSYNDYMHIPPEDMTQRDFELAYYNMPAVDQLRQYMFETSGDPEARRAYWEDVYPNLLPMDRVVVDRFLDESGINVPNEAEAAYAANNPNAASNQTDPTERRRLDLREFFASPAGEEINLASSANQQMLLNEQRRGPAKYTTEDLNPVTGHEVTNYNLQEGGVLRPEVLEAIKRASWLQGNSVQGNSPIEVDPWEEDPGTYWNEDLLTPEDVMDLRGIVTAANLYRDTVNYGGWNPSTDLAPDSNTLVQSGTHQATGTIAATDTNQTLADPDLMDPYELDALVADGTPFGGSGFMSPTGEISNSSTGLGRSIMNLARGSLKAPRQQITPAVSSAKQRINPINLPAAPKTYSKKALLTSGSLPVTGKKRAVKLRF